MQDMAPKSFTNRLWNLADDATVPASSLRVDVQGPYGKLSVDLRRYTTLFLVGGGIGERIIE